MTVKELNLKIGALDEYSTLLYDMCIVDSIGITVLQNENNFTVFQNENNFTVFQNENNFITVLQNENNFWRELCGGIRLLQQLLRIFPKYTPPINTGYVV